MNNKKSVFVLIAFFNLILANISNVAKAQQISPYIYGQNAWMPDSIGSKKFYGKFEANWTAVAQSGAKMVRYGGIGVDENNPTKYQYVKMVDQMRANGVEPVLQVPFDAWKYGAQNAAAIVQHVNITKGKNVKYWIIGNEPDLGYSYTSASQVASYIKQFASAMKAVDPTIKIIGPEVAWYNTNIINGLTTPGGAYDITGRDGSGRFYIDYISFHAYPLLAGATSRSSIISNLTAPGKFEANLTELNARLASCNSYHNRTGTSAIRSAVTEINVNYQNPAGDNLYGVGASSFLGGQYWAEVLGIAMKKNVAIVNFWSTIEGNSDELNIGYLHRGTYQKKPSYYHFQMLAQNFSGTYANGTDNQANVKAFGSKNSTQIAVMVMNQDAGVNFNYTVRLDASAVSGSNPLKINISAGVAKEYSGTISNQSTQVLIFDLAGNLVKKIDYGLNSHAASNQAPTTQTISASSTSTTLTATIAAAGGVTNICPGGNVVLNASTGTGYTYQWRKNGVNISGATASSYIATTAGSYSVKIVKGTATAYSAPINITAAAITATITPAGSTSIGTGGSVVLNANTGSGYTYQWKKNGTNISGATGASYTATAAGSYVVVVRSGTCSATSSAVNVTTGGLTATITPASSTTFATGGSVLLKANTGTGYTYQWKKNGSSISGATYANYTATTAGSYVVVVKSGSLTATSAAVTVTVTSLSAKITPAGPTTFAAGGSVVLQGNTGTGYIYKWKKNGVDIPGATSANYTATTSGSYQLKITLGTASAYSSPVTVTVNGTVASITPAGPVSICSGGTIKLQANTGTGYTYQWKKNGVNISGATYSSYTVSSAGSYSVVVKVGTSVTTSAPVAVSIGTADARITVGGGSTVLPSSGTGIMLYAATATGYTYQWRKNGVSIPGATSTSYRVTSAGSYQLKVTLGSCTDYSSPVSITGSSSARLAGEDSLNNEAGDASYEQEMIAEEIKPGDGKGEGRSKSDGKGGSTVKAGEGKGSAPVQAGHGKGGGEVQPGEGKGSSAPAQEEDAARTGVEAVAENIFNVSIGPNPTLDQFGITVSTSGLEPVKVKVYDMNGRLCIEENDLAPNETVKLGHQLAAGHYIAHIEQGEKKEVVKLVKVN